MNTKAKNYALCGVAAAALASVLLGANPALAQSAANESVHDVGTLVVTGERRSAILPTETDAFGLGMSQLETPRSTSTVSLAMINQYSLTTVRDLIAVTPGVFTASFFGVDGTVNVRGELADNYFRGFKRVENQGTYITPIESALTLDIVRGVASPAYGAGRAGGYVNFTPRSDRALRFRNGQEAQGEASFGVGAYSYGRAAVEYGAPISIGGLEAGFDIYAETTQSTQYFHGIEPKHAFVQLGFATALPNAWELQAGLQIYDASGMQGSTGLNRLTQDLVDNGNYISGSPIAQVVSPGAAYITPADIIAAGGLTKYFGLSNAYSQLDPSTIQTVRLSRHAMLTSEYDFGDAATTTAYVDLSRELGGGTLKLQGFFDDLEADSYNGYGFVKSLRNDVTELRVSYTGEARPASWFDAAYVAGVGYRRYQADEGYVFARGYMVFDRQDISVGATPDSIFNPVYETGEPFDQFYHFTASGYSAFFNTDVALYGGLKFTGGLRYDDYDVKSSNTGLVDWSAPLNTVYRNSDGAVSWSASLSYVTPFGLVPYYTEGESYALETTQGGAVNPGNVVADTFLSPARLREFGVKGQLFDGRLFFGLSHYRQKRTQSQLLSGEILGATTRGLEAEMRWAINRHFGLSAVATRQKTNVGGSAFLVVTPVTFGLAYTDGWGFNYQASTLGVTGVNSYEDKTQPRYVFGLFGNYEMGNGFGATLGGNYVDSTSGHLPGAIVYPSYYLLRGSMHYNFGRYRLALNVNNITDERYFVPQRSSNTEGSAFPGEGRTAMLRLTAQF